MYLLTHDTISSATFSEKVLKDAFFRKNLATNMSKYLPIWHEERSNFFSPFSLLFKCARSRMCSRSDTLRYKHRKRTRYKERDQRYNCLFSGYERVNRIDSTDCAVSKHWHRLLLLLRISLCNIFIYCGPVERRSQAIYSQDSISTKLNCRRQNSIWYDFIQNLCVSKPYDSSTCLLLAIIVWYHTVVLCTHVHIRLLSRRRSRRNGCCHTKSPWRPEFKILDEPDCVSQRV